jgi:hypothetical protein
MHCCHQKKQQKHIVFAASLNTYEHGGIRTPAPQDRNLMLYPLNHVPLYSVIIAQLWQL